MGRPNADVSHSRPRGTPQVLSMINDLGLSACIGVNNVGNAFTPYGTGDPLQLASWAVGIYQAGTVDDAHILYECVSGRAREAISLDSGCCIGRHIRRSNLGTETTRSESAGFGVTISCRRPSAESRGAAET
ncbi:hypothetical protein DL766_005823 [Monosporascus sp. MC13-8B]|uniref:Uncharacterized protein n=1 Tax=Monosporascus cannonballus TaxID=155416 RepID=A0ABY0H8A8_9PEZI|nr:hypothetical protein DL762_004614 [Monosporascus cannonballus]RYO95903.1 hypothetical protein DL763_003451 [Monosporascus cannonballus]RYP28537.1 hypothetical protein DL766_005823 [Monosporascus sp. MC13-8B]